jgi:ABC transport system ATP-binding/permease protein
MSKVAHFRLTIQEGSQAGKAFEILEGPALIGRDPGVDCYLPDEAVSRRHTRLTYEDGCFFIEDLQSRNGTFVNGEIVKGIQRISPGDKIRLGQVVTLVLDTADRPAVDESFPATLNDSPRTLFEAPGTKVPAAEAQLMIQVAGQAPKTVALARERLTLGRAGDNDIVIGSMIVSRRHAVLEKAGTGYCLTVFPEAANRLLVGGQPVSPGQRLYHNDEITIDYSEPGHRVSFTYWNPADPRPAGMGKPTDLKVAPEEGTVYRPKPSLTPATPAYPAPGGQGPELTMLGTDDDLELPLIPPSLLVACAGSPPQTYTILGEQVTIGRARDNQIVIPSPIISRHHARLERVAGGYSLTVLPDAINQLVCQGRAVAGQVHLHHGDVLRIDSDVPGMMVTMVYQSPSEAQANANVHTIKIGDSARLTFGRDPGNDVQLNTPSVSRFHAQVERIGQRYRLIDLRSSNGTFVNDVRVQGETWLHPQDTIRIGPYRLVMGEDAFTRFDESSGMCVEAAGLNKWVRKNLNILEDISLVFQPREFVVVVGQSGGGKSTLLDAIAGYRPATHGHVYVNGTDIYQHFDAIRNEIGYVPQRDIIHMELTVYQALDYAARLRMPRDTKKSERHQRIMEVLQDLDLVHRKDVQVSGLSGGQQKRVSIGVELLTSPGLFFLDEPTSGLDPGTETAFMHLMRRLADQGRTIVMVTHATKNVMLADKVVFLARGGHLAWFGPPEEALTFFDQFRSEQERRARPMEFDQIYTILDDPSKGKASDWAARFREHAAYRQHIVQPLQERQARLGSAGKSQEAPRKRAKRQRSASGLHQFFTLSARNIKILTRDRTSLILMLLAAPLVGSLDYVVAPLMGKSVYDYNLGDGSNAATSLFLLVVNCLLVGGLSQMREFVKEGEIYKRERLVNLKLIPYVLSKVWVAMLLALYQAGAYLLIRYTAYDMPGGAEEMIYFYITLLLAILAGMSGGLLVSAFAPGGSSAPLLMILLLIPQIVLSGALAPVPDTVSAIASTRWAFEGFIGITGIGSDVAADRCWDLAPDLREEMTLEDKEEFGCNCMGVAIFQPGSCDFPGVGKLNKEEVDQPAPPRPADLPPKPAEPDIPPAPEKPGDTSDSIALAQYMEAMQAYQKEIETIQADYKNQMELYESQAVLYQAEMEDYQEAYTLWNTARSGAIKSAEALIESISKEFGWAYVDKSDPGVYRAWLQKVWASQGIVILAYFGLILFFMKRKDVS